MKGLEFVWIGGSVPHEDRGFGFTWGGTDSEALRLLFRELRWSGVSTIALQGPEEEDGPIVRARALAKAAGLDSVDFFEKESSGSRELWLRDFESGAEAGPFHLLDKASDRISDGLLFSPHRRKSEVSATDLSRWIFRRKILNKTTTWQVYPHPTVEVSQARVLRRFSIANKSDCKGEDPALSLVVPLRPSRCVGIELEEMVSRWIFGMKHTRGEIILVVNEDEGQLPGKDWVDRNLVEPLRRSKVSFQLMIVEGKRGVFIAGHCRNVGAAFARGKVLAFLDADTKPEGSWFTEIIRLHETPGRLSCSPRWNVLRRPDGVTEVDHASMEAYWREFNENAPEFLERDEGWKYVCSHSLAMNHLDWIRLGGFGWAYQNYGYEDTDLAFRARRQGLALKATRARSYHFDHRHQREGSSARVRSLRASAEVFLRSNPTLELAHHTYYLFRQWPHRDILKKLSERLSN